MSKNPIYSHINVQNKPFLVKYDVNVNPTKNGIKIQFLPLTADKKSRDTSLSLEQKNALASQIQQKYNQKLSKYNLNIDSDTDVPDGDVIGFILRLPNVSNFINKALKEPGS